MIRMYHSVGASDPLTEAETTAPIGDGLPKTLEDWIPYRGITAIEIRLNGSDLSWDVDRVAAIDRITGAAQEKREFRNLDLSARFQRALPERTVSARFRSQAGREGPPVLSTAYSTSNSDVPRSGQ
jgi:hypothetical protein